MAYRPSAETDAMIVALYRELGNGCKVAKQLGFNDRTVYRVLAQNGVDTDKARSQHLRKFKGDALNRLVAEYEQGMPASDLAVKYSCATITVLDALRQAGVIIRGPKPHMTAAKIEEARAMYASGMTFKQVAERTGRHENSIMHLMNDKFPDLVRSGTVGPGSPHWQGGTYVHHGYVYAWVADNDPMASMRSEKSYVLEHRLVLARKLGRPLGPHETVHHINGDKTDNRPENLQLRHGKHGKHSAMVCLDCGSHNVGHQALE